MRVWKNDAGYVIIRIMGKYPEKLLNALLEEGTPLRDVKRSGEAVTLSLPTASLHRLRQLKRGCSCRVELVSKGSRPRLGKRISKAFAVSLAAFLLMALAASTRIWSVEILSETVPAEDIAAALYSIGIRPGAARNRNGLREASEALMRDPRVVNAEVRLNGVKLTVRISGAAESIPDRSEGESYGMAAAKDCVITRIAVTGGRALVQSGSIVKAGELIVTGDLSALKPGLTVPVQAVVYGRVLYTVSATAEAEKPSLVRSGRQAIKAVVCTPFGEFSSELPFAEYETEPFRSFVFDACAIPVVIRQETAYELTEQTVRDTALGTEKRARLVAQEKLSSLIPREAQINTVSTRTVNNPDGSVTAIITVTATEQIGIPTEITWKKSN